MSAPKTCQRIPSTALGVLAIVSRDGVFEWTSAPWRLNSDSYTAHLRVWLSSLAMAHIHPRSSRAIAVAAT